MKTKEDEVEELVALMQQAAEKASRAVLESLGREESGRVIGRNPSATPTRTIDKVSEDILLAEMRESRVPLLVVSEEEGIVELGKKPRYVLVVDPLDGTTNALHGIPFFAVSLGLAELTETPSLKDMLAGVVRDVMRGVSYSAVREQGFKAPSSLVGMVPRSTEKTRPLVSLYGYGVRTGDRGVLKIMESSLQRTLGSVSLEMCLLARGSLDAFVDIRNLTRVVDVAAALVILQESGCTVSDAKGEELENPLTASEGLALVAARSKKLHRRLIEMVNPST